MTRAFNIEGVRIAISIVVSVIGGSNTNFIIVRNSIIVHINIYMIWNSIIILVKFNEIFFLIIGNTIVIVIAVNIIMDTIAILVLIVRNTIIVVIII